MINEIWLLHEKTKTRRLVRGTVSPDRAEKALSLLERPEEIDNAAKVLRLLFS
jgi:hypothetical protein